MGRWRTRSRGPIDRAMPERNEPNPPPRSSGALRRRRKLLSWPKGHDFRILSIDGGGIRGIFPAAFLADLEDRYLGGSSIARYFDMIAGTSTGGIIAIGLAAGLRAADLRDLYIDRGREIFPDTGKGIIGAVQRRRRHILRLIRYGYSRKSLENIMRDTLGNRKFGEANSRLCIPSFDGRHGEMYIFKTPHHPDFQNDRDEYMRKVALATAAAPTYFQPLREGGYRFVDGGIWANNPVMIALVDALSCFSLPRERIRILTVGCGAEKFVVGRWKILTGGMLPWYNIIEAAMQLQSANALGQAGLLLGADRMLRIEPGPGSDKIKLDDWLSASTKLPQKANDAVEKWGASVQNMFLTKPAMPYRPVTV